MPKNKKELGGLREHFESLNNTIEILSGKVERLVKIINKLNQDNQELNDELDKYREALIWCGASEDFQEGGQARKGWLKLCVPLIKTIRLPKEWKLLQKDDKSNRRVKRGGVK